MNEYDYLNARIKGLSTTLLTPAFFEEVLTVPGQEGVVDALLNTPYGPDLRDALTEGQDVIHAENGLRRNLFETFTDIRRLAPEEAQKLLAIPFRWWDLNNIITILRGKVFNIEEDRIQPGLFPAGFLDDARLNELCSETDVIAVADALVIWDIPDATKLRRLLRMYPEPERFHHVQNAAYRDYVIWAQSQVEGKSENTQLIRSHFLRQVDLLNVLAALRHVREGSDQETSFEPIGQGHISVSTLQQLARSTDLDSAIEILAGTSFSKAIERGIFAFGEQQRLGALERFLEQIVLEAGCRLFRTDPLGIGVVAGYIWRKLNEFLNLRILLRGKAYGRPAMAIQEDLFLV